MFVFCLIEIAYSFLLEVIASPWKRVPSCSHHLFARNHKLLEFLLCILIIIQNKPAAICPTRFELLAQIVVLLSFLLRPCVSSDHPTATEAKFSTKRVAARLTSFVMAQSLSIVVPYRTLGIIILAFIGNLLIGGLCSACLFDLSLRAQNFSILINLLKLRDFAFFIRSAAVDRLFNVPENIVRLLLFCLRRYWCLNLTILGLLVP